MPICTICRKDLPPESFYKDRWRTSGCSSRCKPCHVKNKLHRRRGGLELRYDGTDERVNCRNCGGPRGFQKQLCAPCLRKNKQVSKRRRDKTPAGKLHRRAMRFVSDAVLVGLLKRGPCIRCGGDGTQFHHLKGVTDPRNWLLVVSMCPKCHGKVHGELGHGGVEREDAIGVAMRRTH